MFVNENVGESSNHFSCENCHFYTVKKFNYDKHLSTAKHLKSMIVNENVGKRSKRSTDSHTCTICQKNYKEPSGLWRHKKKCIVTNNNSTPIIERLLTKTVSSLFVVNSNFFCDDVSSSFLEHIVINSNFLSKFFLLYFISSSFKK